jgi:hypothetical protein
VPAGSRRSPQAVGRSRFPSFRAPRPCLCKEIRRAMETFDGEDRWPELPDGLLFLNGSRAGSSVRLDQGRVFFDINRARKFFPFLPFGLPVRAPFEGAIYFGIERSKEAPSAYDVWTTFALGHITLNGNPRPDVIKRGASDGLVIRPVSEDILTIGLFPPFHTTPLRLQFFRSDSDDERLLGPWLVPNKLPH